MPTLPARRAPVSQENRDRSLGLPRHDPGRNLHGFAAITQLDDVFVLDTEPACQGRAQERGIVPGEFGQRLGQLLEPAVIGEAAVPIVGSGRKTISRLSGPSSAGAAGMAISLTLGETALGLLAVPAINPASRAVRQASSKSPGRFLAPPVVADDLQARSIGLAQEDGQQLVSRLALVERSDQRLLDRRRPVKRPQVAPRFEAMGLGDMPVAELGRLIVIEPEVDAQLDLVAAEHRGEIEVRRGIVGRVSAEDDQGVDGAGVHVSDQLAERADLVGRPRVHPSDEFDRLADVAESVVDQVGERVNLGRLRLAGNNQALAAMGSQVACQRGDPAGVAGEPVREFAARPAARLSALSARGDGLCKQGDIPRRNGQPVIGRGAGEGRRAARRRTGGSSSCRARRRRPRAAPANARASLSRPGPRARKSASSDTITSARSR